jgi:hypothetical protein
MPYEAVHKSYNGSLIDSLKDLKFETKNKKKYIPRFIKKNLKCWENRKFRIANPGKLYNDTDYIVRNLPRRRMNYLGLNKSYIVLSYDHGGRGHHQHILIFKVSNKNIKEVYNLNSNINSAEELVILLKHLNEQKDSFTNSQEF